MAIINSSAVGKATGSLGNMTYSTQEGRTIARDRVRTVRNPNTAGQQEQRGYMRDIVFGYSKIGQDLNKLFTKRKKYNSPYNTFVSVNIGNPSTYEADYLNDAFVPSTGFIFGVGKYPASAMAFEGAADNEAEIKVVSKSLQSALKIGDIIGGVAFDERDNSVQLIELVIKTIPAPSADGSMVFTVPIVGTNLMQYSPFYLSADGKSSVTCIR